MSSENAVIEVQNLSKDFDGFWALKNLSMHVEKGSVYGLVGPNGAGKSTLLRHIMGVYKPTSGSVYVNHEPVFENVEQKGKIAYIPDELFYFQQANVKDMMKYFKGIYPRFDMERFEKLKEIFPNIDLKRPIRKFSKGMQKQAMFWLMLCCHPEIFVLDEPVDGLDPVMRRQIWSLLMADAAEYETTVLVSSHNLRELEDVCDYVGILNHGELVLERSLLELQDNMTKLQVAYENELPDLPEELNVLNVSNTGRIYTIIAKGSPAQCQEIIAKTNPILVDALPLTLEEIFIYELGGIGYECKNIIL